MTFGIKLKLLIIVHRFWVIWFPLSFSVSHTKLLGSLPLPMLEHNFWPMKMPHSIQSQDHTCGCLYSESSAQGLSLNASSSSCRSLSSVTSWRTYLVTQLAVLPAPSRLWPSTLLHFFLSTNHHWNHLNYLPIHLLVSSPKARVLFCSPLNP